MPESRTFTVTESRTVRVTANTAADAVRLADQAFSGKSAQHGRGGLRSKEGLDGVWGDTTTWVRQVELNAQEGF